MVSTTSPGIELQQSEEKSSQEMSLQQTNSSDDPLECRICSYKSFSLSYHLLSAHGLLRKDYLEKFPGEKTLKKKNDPEKKKKISTKESALRKKEMYDAGIPELVCQICGFCSPLSIISHITRKHALSMSQYRERYPGSKVQQNSPAQNKKASEFFKKKLSDPESLSSFLQWRSYPSEIKHWTKKGFSEEEAREKVAQFQSSQSLKGNNEKTRKLRSEKNLGQKNPMSLSSISEREGVSIDVAKSLTPCFGRTGQKHPMFGKKHSAEALKKIGLHLNHTGKSFIEHEMSNILISLYDGEKNIGVNGWSCDYVNHQKKLVVELFGDFWHHHPQKYDADYVNPFTKRTSAQVWERDRRKISDISEHGYSIVVIWESEWKQDKAECLERIKNAYNRTL